MLETLRQESERLGHDTQVVYAGEPVATVRPDAFKRCLANLLTNAARHGDANPPRRLVRRQIPA